MSRVTFIPAAFLALSAWAGAQGPPPLTAADQLRLLRTNRVLIGDLVDCGVKLGVTDRPVDRAETCRETARVLGIALRGAAEAQDADRVEELGSHLDLLVRDGLVPVLDEAKKNTPADSPDAKRLKAVQENAVGDLEWARAAIPTAGKVGDSPKVRDVCGRLDGLRDRLK
ncbi:MAG: hypothetical protein JWO38_5276 [Gemmataceae bacterium]|nr:hypothetical protein [Gemmataceae bacterium]